MKKKNKFTANNKRWTSETPFGVLENYPLVNEEGKMSEFYKMSARGRVFKNLKFSDFINEGIKYIQEDTKDVKDTKNQSDDGRTDAQIGSSGDSAQIGSSGYSAQIDIKGSDSIGFACGRDSLIKGKKGTWISLAEYKLNKKGIYVPSFALSAQIGNSEYKDCFGKTLQPNTYYTLVDKQFTPVAIVDRSKMVILNKKNLEDTVIYKTQYLEDFKIKLDKYQFVAQKGEITAHGKSIKEAIDDVQFKFLQSQDVKEHVKRVKEQGFITPNDYRLLTGACRYGTNKWLEENNFTWEDKKTIDEVIELTKGEYGHERLVALFKEK